MSENEDSKVLAQLKGLLDVAWLQDKAKALGVVTQPDSQPQAYQHITPPTPGWKRPEVDTKPL